jgi:hypothetical protein
MKKGFLLLIIVALCIYGYFTHPQPTLKQCLLDPEKYDGYPLKVFGEVRAGSIHKEGFEFVEEKSRVWVKPRPKDIKDNEFIEMQVVFHKEGYLELLQYYIHKGRRLKIAVSAIAVVVVMLLFFREYKFDLKRGLFVERKTYA